MKRLSKVEQETLRQVDRRDRSQVVGMQPTVLAEIASVTLEVARERLNQCFDRGLLYRMGEPKEYGLTPTGREALEGKGR
jgi:hypothetical protein